MALQNLFAEKLFLIIDDLPNMRTTLRMQVSNLGATKIHLAGSIKQALEFLADNFYHVILCDYFMGESTNGQQFLEYLRAKNLVSHHTLFVMVTAEQTYERVVAVAEQMPDDYLIKPFTAETLKMRLLKLIERKNRFYEVDRFLDLDQWEDVLVACNEIIESRNKYLLDALRIKGDALLELQRYPNAENFYQQVIAMRPMAWARMGLARALVGQGRMEEAMAILREVIAENPQYLSAYDELGRVFLAQGKNSEALGVLKQGCDISPSSLNRHRVAAGVAETVKDYDAMETALRRVVSQNKYSPLKTVNDYLKLSEALLEKKDPENASAALREARGEFFQKEDQAALAATETVALLQAGKDKEAEKSLARAVQFGGKELQGDAALMMARAFLASGDIMNGESILRRVVQNDPDSEDTKAKVFELMAKHTDSSRASALLEFSVREVIALNNDAVRKAQAGQLAEAVKMLEEAAERLPGNIQVVGNAAYALLLDILQFGMDEQKLDRANRYTDLIRAKDAAHPKLQQIADTMRRVQEQYRLGAV